MGFKITKGVTPPRRGPKYKIADYTALFPMLAKMEPGDSIKIAEVPSTRRNSTYVSVTNILKPKIEELGGGFRVATTNIADDLTEVRIYRLDEAETKGVGRKKK